MLAWWKKDLLAEKQDLFEKNERKSPFSGKKVLGYKKKQELQKQKSIKTGFIWEKKAIIKTEKRRISSHPVRK